jgi:hypothetical protein
MNKVNRSYVKRAADDDASVEWDIASDPRMLEALIGREPWLERPLEQMRRRAPYATTTSSFKSGHHCRLERHNRAFYRLGPTGSVIACKGTEPLADDVEEAFNRLAWHAPLGTSNLEFFVRFEQKVPMALLFEEARDEAEKAYQFQRAYVKRYGEFATMPVPLLVLRWAPRVATEFLRKIKPGLSERAWRGVKRLSEGGFGAYIYYYPNPPLRVQHVADRLPPLTQGYRERAIELGRTANLESAIRGWVALVVRMLGLGYFPCSLDHDEIGQCVREQNVVLDGGLVDVDSMTKFSSIADDATFAETMMATLFELIDTIHTIWVTRHRPTSFRQLRTGTTTFLIVWQFVAAEFRAAMEREERAGVTFDRRVKEALAGSVSFADIDRRLTLLNPPQPTVEGAAYG